MTWWETALIQIIGPAIVAAIQALIQASGSRALSLDEQTKLNAWRAISNGVGMLYDSTSKMAVAPEPVVK